MDTIKLCGRCCYLFTYICTLSFTHSVLNFSEEDNTYFSFCAPRSTLTYNNWTYLDTEKYLTIVMFSNIFGIKELYMNYFSGLKKGSDYLEEVMLSRFFFQIRSLILLYSEVIIAANT